MYKMLSDYFGYSIDKNHTNWVLNCGTRYHYRYDREEEQENVSIIMWREKVPSVPVCLIMSSLWSSWLISWMQRSVLLLDQMSQHIRRRRRRVLPTNTTPPRHTTTGSWSIRCSMNIKITATMYIIITITKTITWQQQHNHHLHYCHR